MKYINRWGLMWNTRQENLKEHSFDAAVISHALAVIGNRFFDKNLNADKIAVYALFHDGAEISTGDLPTPIKYFSSEIRSAYAGAEIAAKHKLLTMLPNDLKQDYSDLLFCEENNTDMYKYIKAADILCAYTKCLEEIKCGNNEFLHAKDATLKKIDALDMPEVKYFMDNFIAGYTLTLDEQ